MITLYTKPDCMQYDLSKRYLEYKGIEFKEVNIFKDDEALKALRSKGITQMPVIIADGHDPISGFRPLKIEKLIMDEQAGGTEMNMSSLVKSVEVWAMNKGLDKADPRAQYLKVVEEVGEIAAGLARNNKFATIDAIGDSLVTLIILAKTIDSSAVECLDTAYDVIKDRTGKVVDGVFIKDGE